MVVRSTKSANGNRVYKPGNVLCYRVFATILPLFPPMVTGTHNTKKQVTLLAVIVIVAAAGVGYWKFSGNPDALRKSCLNNACPISYSIKNPAPCAEVKPRAGWRRL